MKQEHTPWAPEHDDHDESELGEYEVILDDGTRDVDKLVMSEEYSIPHWEKHESFVTWYAPLRPGPTPKGENPRLSWLRKNLSMESFTGTEVSRMSFEEKMGNTFFFVEATEYEASTLWKEWADDNIAIKLSCSNDRRLKWEQIYRGHWLVIKDVRVNGEQMPIAASFFWYVIGGRLVCFYNATSAVVDNRVIEKWIDKNTSRSINKTRRIDANNFHICIEAIEKSNEKDFVS